MQAESIIMGGGECALMHCTFDMLQYIFHQCKLLHWLPDTEIRTYCYVRSHFPSFIAHGYAAFFYFIFLLDILSVKNGRDICGIC
jgi:hypothetical protein